MSVSRSGFTYIVGIKCNHKDHKIYMGQSQLYPWEKWFNKNYKYTLMKEVSVRVMYMVSGYVYG